MSRSLCLLEEKINHTKASAGHYVIKGNTNPKELSNSEVVEAYKGQHHVERGFRFLKDPCLEASSFFVKSPKRIMGLTLGHAVVFVGLRD